MRKLFLNLMAVAICSLVITSCVKGPDDVPPSPPTPPTPPEPTPVEKYNKAFLNYVGGEINPEQDWGFGDTDVAETRFGTRAEDQGCYDLSTNYPKEYTWDDFMKEVLDSLPEGKKVGESIKNFEFISRGPFRFEIPYAYTKAEFEIGYYFYNPATQNVFARTEKTLFKNFKSEFASKEYLQYSTFEKPSDDQWLTVKSTYGYWLWDQEKGYEAKKTRARMITIRDGSEDNIVDVPKGYRIGFYVKRDNKTVYTNRYLNENEQPFFAVIDSRNESSHLKRAYLVGMEEQTSAEGCDFDCNDVIFDVHKHIEEQTYPLLYIPRKTWRIIAEDLSASENTDFDFNDIVLDVTLTKDGADCVLQAAGAELPIRVNGDDKLEVHKLFEVDQKVMVNTNAEKKGLKGETKEPVKFSLTGKFNSVKDVKIEVNKGTAEKPNWIPLYANQGEPACKIAVGTDFKWPDELESIKVKYPKFVDWVKDPAVVWY